MRHIARAALRSMPSVLLACTTLALAAARASAEVVQRDAYGEDPCNHDEVHCKAVPEAGIDDRRILPCFLSSFLGFFWPFARNFLPERTTPGRA